MKIDGDSNNMTVTYEVAHAAWKSEQTVLSVDALSVTLCTDGSVRLRSKDGRLVRSGDFILVYPGWYDKQSDITTNTKTPIFRNSVACCYEITQQSNKRKGYVLAFQEPEDHQE